MKTTSKNPLNFRDRMHHNNNKEAMNQDAQKVIQSHS